MIIISSILLCLLKYILYLKVFSKVSDSLLILQK